MTIATIAGAEQTYRELVGLEPQRSAPSYGLAATLLLQRKTVEARDQYEHVDRWNPSRRCPCVGSDYAARPRAIPPLR